VAGIGRVSRLSHVPVSVALCIYSILKVVKACDAYSESMHAKVLYQTVKHRRCEANAQSAARQSRVRQASVVSVP